MCLVAVQIIGNYIDKHFVFAQNIICPYRPLIELSNNQRPWDKDWIRLDLDLLYMEYNYYL